MARALREKATLEADILVKADIRKKQIEIEAEAEAEKIRRQAKGEADAIFVQMEAQARGTQEVLTKQALGLAQVVDAAGGNAADAMRLMLTDKMEDLMKVQVEAIKNIKIDKVTVWDGAAGEKTATAGFLSGLVKSLPPLHELFDMAGMQLPNFMGQPKPTEITETPPEAAEAAEPEEAEDVSL
jgi:flotillin